MIDYWGELLESIEPINLLMATCKTMATPYIMNNNIQNITGKVFESGLTKAMSNTEITSSVADIVEILRKQKKLHLLDTVFKVAIGDTRKALGDAFIETIGETKTSKPSGIRSPKRRK